MNSPFSDLSPRSPRNEFLSVAHRHGFEGGNVENPDSELLAESSMK